MNVSNNTTDLYVMDKKNSISKGLSLALSNFCSLEYVGIKFYKMYHNWLYSSFKCKNY